MRTLAFASLLLAVAACRIKGDPSFDTTVAATCGAVSHVCAGNGDCCSYACLGGLCVANERAGGLCRSSDDCDFTMRCDAGHCRPGLVCVSVNSTCASNNECCSGNCLGENPSVYPPVTGTCGTETPPLVELGGPFTVPYYATTTLHATVTDPDREDVFYYAWDVISAPTGALTGWTSSAAAPSVFLPAKGTYLLRVRVADGPSTQRNRGTAVDTVTIVAVNLPPVVSADPTHLASTALRHTAIPLVGAVSDPDGTASPISCTWYARPPGGAEYAIASFPACPASPATSYTTPIDSAEGLWEFRLEASDGELTTSAIRRVDVQNAAPVALACAYECQAPPPGGTPFVRVGNLGPAGQPAPPIPLHGSATDENGDVGTAGFTWSWSLVSAPPGSSGSAGLVRNTGTGTAPPFDGALDPDAAGTYVVQLHVDDGHGATADATVPVHVEPYLRPLYPVDGGTGLPFGGDVPGAVYAHATDRLVFIGAEESSGAQRVWQLDPESSPTAATPYANLARAPVALAVDPTGTSGLVAEAGYFERLSLSGTPSTSGSTYLGFTPNEVLDAGNREFALAPGGQVYDISSANSSPGIATCNTGSTCAGTRGAAATDVLWLLDEATGILRRYTVQPSGKLDQTAAASGLGAASAVWASAAYGGAQDVVASTGTRYADTIAALTLAAPSLPFALRHLDTTAVGAEIRGAAVASSGAEVRTVGAGWQAPAESGLALPAVGYLGTGYPTTARYGFVRSDGSRTYVVLRVLVAGKVRWYLMRY